MDTRIYRLIVIYKRWICKEDIALVRCKVIKETSDLMDVPNGSTRRCQEVCGVFDCSHGSC